jgi:hypothetical protein
LDMPKEPKIPLKVAQAAPDGASREA